MTMVGLFRRLTADNAGVSAIEFALFAPFLFFAAVAMVDLGLAIGERMTMDRMLRGGAQSAMRDPGEAKVRSVIEASAPSDMTPGTDLTLTVARVCACPSAPDIVLVCTAVCTDGVLSGTYYRMSAERTFSAILLPDVTLTTSTEVQVR